MSYDFSTKVKIDGKWYTCQDAGNYTYNVSDMYCACLEEIGVSETYPSITKWNSLYAWDVLFMVEGILRIMRNDPKRFRAMSPANGWGNYAGALKYMRDIRLAIRKSPREAIVSID